ncbi:MAG: hypothetical protein BWY69_00859 [Planctomycetes bacterium ADurb.Bin401]|nr:MAG: hypothetical protein BWY69_00859 [Planctomycetes bacterium ADurb.Bin401]
MGWRSKFLFMVIIYFAGFATAVYYLAPQGSCSEAENQQRAERIAALNDYGHKAYDKVVAGFASMKGYDYKSAYYRGIESLNNLKEKYDSKAEEPQ